MWKIAIFIIIIMSAIIAICQGYEKIKEKFLYEFISKKLQNYCRNKYGANLSIGKVRGSLLRDLYLEDVCLGAIEGLPQNIQVKSELIKFQYSFWELIRHDPRIEVRKVELICGNIKMPIVVFQHGKAITLTFGRNFLYLSHKDVLSSDLALNGLCNLNGFIVLRRFKPVMLNIQIASDNLKVLSSRFKANINLNLILKGDSFAPVLTGFLYFNDFSYTGEIDDFKSADIPLLPVPDRFSTNITIKGENIKVRNKSLDCFLKADLKLKKEQYNQPYLSGRIELIKGIYNAYQNKFKLTKGEITFPDAVGKEPDFNIIAQIKVRRYQIFAVIQGTLKNSHLELSSKPFLSRNEIVSLLLFGKKIANLGISEKAEFLNTRGLTESFVAKLFLGKAEAKVAEFIGVDELSIKADDVSTLKPQELRMPAVEVGKSIGKNNKLYGTYGFDPAQTAGNKPSQTIGGEYAVTENIKIKGERDYTESIKLPEEDKFSIEFEWKF